MKIKLEDLLEFEKETGLVSKSFFSVNTRHGYKRILNIAKTAENSERYLLKTNNRSLISSPDHLLFTTEWKKVKELKYKEELLTEAGYEQITFCNLIEGKSDLYDIEVEEVHEFYANGIVSHNSTVSNVIKFLLYGKVDGVNLNELPNRINKNLWGKIKIEAKGKVLEIERGLLPNIFNVWIDSVVYDQAGKLNVQDYLEKEFYGIPFNVFKNIVILSINDFKSFLTMSPADKKNIIDKLFGFSIINEMVEELKRERKRIEDEIREYDRDLGMISESITSISKKLDDLEKKSKDKNREKVIEIKNRLTKLNDERKQLDKVRLNVDGKMRNVNDHIDSLTSTRYDIVSNITKHQEKIDFLEKERCPFCESVLDTSFHIEMKERLNDDIKKQQEEHKNIDNKIKKFKSSYMDLRDAQQKIISKMSSLETSMKTLKEDLVDHVAGDKNMEFEQLENLISESKVKEEEKYRFKLEKNDESYFLKLVTEVLGDDGIKNLAMKTILPSLNSNVSELIRKIHLPFTIVFDEKFDVNISSMGEIIRPATMSTGEKKKAEFIVIIALIKLVKIRYPSLNILFLDEIFSGIDADGIYTITRALAETIKEIGINAFVINHSYLPTEVFDKTIEVNKKNGFSNLIIGDVL